MRASVRRETGVTACSTQRSLPSRTAPGSRTRLCPCTRRGHWTFSVLLTLSAAASQILLRRDSSLGTVLGTSGTETAPLWRARCHSPLRAPLAHSEPSSAQHSSEPPGTDQNHTAQGAAHTSRRKTSKSWGWKVSLGTQSVPGSQLCGVPGGRSLAWRDHFVRDSSV